MNLKGYNAIGAQAKDLAIRKNEDYGMRNIYDTGTVGIVVRLFDKVSRLRQLVLSENADPNFETLEDTFLDIINYAIFGIMLEKDEWLK